MLTRFAAKTSILAAIVFTTAYTPAFAQSPPGPSRPEFPPMDKVLEGFKQVVSTADGKPSLYTLWVNNKTNQMYAELPRNYASMKQFIAVTVASGERYAGLQGNDFYVYWRRYDNRLALIAPNVDTRSTGDAESKSSVERLFTDRVLLDLPIVTENPKTKGPIIDMDAFLVGNASSFFPGARAMNPKLASIKVAKAFPSNVEVSFEIASSSGLLKELHYSISSISPSPSYKPRAADERIGYFTTSYVDLGKYDSDEKNVRFINRWHLEKADPSLKMSPPKQPIVFYIEHTTPKRYRYWVKQGVLYWNKAFENIGIRDAIEVYQQDADSAAPKYMDLDPEDVRYNFIRWLNNDIATAIGPSRVHPMTGEILDADIILTDGWIRAYERQFSELLPKLAMQGHSPNTLAWLNDHPNWDPRVLLAQPTERARLIRENQLAQLKPMAGHPIANSDPSMLGDDQFDGLTGRTSQVNGLCLAAEGKAFELAILRMQLELAAATDDDDDKDKDKDDEEEEDEEKDKDGEKKEDNQKEDKDKKDDDKEEEKKKEDEKEKPQILDGIPEDFIGPLISDLVAHEVGHTLGLRHNFKASTIYTLEEINSPELKGKPFAGSVMDYLPINMYLPKDKEDKTEPDHTMVAVGPYDMWAIEY
ncbi:MAG: zinc-dependent metalloprotease, partial [Planctomycetales bacterium]|nr:zinc-dependent metalloprotease [Planctomycetales bacterium]